MSEDAKDWLFGLAIAIVGILLFIVLTTDWLVS
jgi:hypothetical protein